MDADSMSLYTSLVANSSKLPIYHEEADAEAPKHITSAIFFNSELDILEAFNTAISDVNDLDTDFYLEPVTHFLSEDDSIVLQQFTCDLLENGVAAIFGPSSKTTSDIVAILCNMTGIPHLQFDWSGDETENNLRKYHYTVNVAPSEHVLSNAMWDILKSKDFDWKSFTIIYESSTNLARMQHLLAWRQFHKTGVKMHRFRRGEDYRVLWKIINNSREKFVVLDCPHDILTEVVNASKYFNMTGPFNHLFLTNLDTHLSGVDGLYSQDFSARVAAIRLRSFMPAQIHNEADVFENEEQDKIVSIRTQCVYDAVVMYFNALKQVFEAIHFLEPTVRCGGGFWQPGQDIVKQMQLLNPKHVKPPYKTQRLLLNDFGIRDDFNLEIYNPLIERLTHVWNKHHGLVSFDKISENSTKEAKIRKFGAKEDFSLKKVKFTVATRIGEPFFMWRPEPEGVHYEGNERFEGFAVDLIYKLAEECRFDFILEPVSDNAYGSRDPVTDEWNGIIRQLIDNNAQLGICDLTITQARRSVVDFTVPFMQLGVSILFYKPKPPEKSLFAFLHPFAVEVWFYLLVALLVMSLCFKVLGRLTQDDWEVTVINKETSMAETPWFLRNTLWLHIGSILCVGCDILPRGLPMRIFTAFWWIFALLMSQTYIAKLASFITASKMEGSIQNLHDLVDQNKIQFGTVKGGSTSQLFSESNETAYRVAWNKMIGFKPEAFTASNKEGMDRVKRSKGRYAFLVETPILQYYEQRNCELMHIGQPFGEKHYGIAVPLNAPFRSNISVGILKLSEKGVLYSLKNKWFNSNETHCDMEEKPVVEDIQFNMESVGGLFVVLIGGIIIAIIIGICEFLWNVQKIAVKEKIPAKVALKSEFRFFIRFWLQRKPLMTYRRRGSNSTCLGSSAQSSNITATQMKEKRKKSKRKRSEKDC
ncbi:glutamate receptor ionotropic, kainate 2 [Calliphora vicina]|uniref:glutamate receptor ionotropic, kainate 2 n=1 Tax=Calliphora vicina TaxID=7373 RepID=UPI00325AF96A